MGSIKDYLPAGDSVSLGEIGGKPFTIVSVEKSNYNDIAGVKITTQESFEVNGEKHNKFHTTRQVITQTLLGESLFKAINEDNLKPYVKCVKLQSKSGQGYFTLEDA